MTIFPEFSTRCTSVVYGGPGSYNRKIKLHIATSISTSYRPVEQVRMACNFPELQ